MAEKIRLFVVTTLLVTTTVQTTGALNVLMLATVQSWSHYVFGNALTNLLLERGHHVYELTTHHPETRHPNRTSFVADIEPHKGFLTPEELSSRSNHQALKLMAEWAVHSCKSILHTKAARDLLAFARDTKNRPRIDVVVHDYITQQCVGPFATEFDNAPVVAATVFGNALELDEVVGGPIFPGFIPHDFVIHPHTNKPMGWLKRLENKWAYLVSHVTRYYQQYPQMDAISKDFFGDHATTIEEYHRKVALVLVNSHPAIQGARPQLPAVIQVGGVHLTPTRELQKGKLKEFLDGAKDGFILMSFGSVVRMSDMQPWRREGLFRAFKRLSPLRILLKWETDWDENTNGPLPDNVFLSPWIPQNDVQAHPNMRLFVTHCGGLTTIEVIAHSVPVVGVPVMYDQFINAHKLVDLKAGVLIPFEDLNEEEFYRAVRTVLDNTQYATAIRQLSSLYYDQPETPKQRAVFWIEFVARHKGAPHLHSPGELQSWVTRWMIDDVIVVIFILAVLVSAFRKICFVVCSSKLQTKSGRSKRD